MATIIARPNQSMQDLVLMACGTLDGAMAFCRANEVSISDVPVVGMEYVIPADIAFDEVVLTDIWQKGIVIGTLHPEIVESPSAYLRIILYPSMVATTYYNALDGQQELQLDANIDFINYNDLPHPWPTINYLKAMLKTDYVLLGDMGAADATPQDTLQSDKQTRYVVGASLIVENVYMWWSDMTTGSVYVPAAYEDVAGYTATCAPLVLLPTTGMLEAQTLIAKLDVSVDSVAGSIIYVLISRSHTGYTVPDFNILAQGWLIKVGPDWAELTGTLIDPDTLLVPFSPGIYEIGVKTNYNNDADDVTWPTSLISMVFEVL